MEPTMTKEEWMQMYKAVGVAMKVYDTLHRGLDEPVYQEAMEMEFALQEIEAEPQKLIHCYYNGMQMKKYYQADFYLPGLMIELKAVEQLCAEHRAQLFNYCRLTHTHRGLLINFGEKSLRSERYLYNPDTDDFILLSQYNYQQYVK